MAVNGVEIKEGQRWLTRTGETVSISPTSGNSLYRWWATSANGQRLSVTDEGRFCAGEVDADDLIALVEDAPEPEWKDYESGPQPADTIGKIIEVRYRSGRYWKGDASRVKWGHRNELIDVTAYRIFGDVVPQVCDPGPTPGSAPLPEIEIENGEGDATVPPKIDLRQVRFGPASLFLDRNAADTASADFAVAAESDIHPYHLLAATLVRAFEQAANGKGKERHATGDTPFHEQPMALINKQIGSVDGFIYQAHKKSLEALRLPQGRNVAEILGAINYLAGAVIALESWAAKEDE